MEMEMGMPTSAPPRPAPVTSLVYHPPSSNSQVPNSSATFATKKMGKIPPWSDLPTELLSIISTRLISNPLDIRNFRCVCKSWSSSSFFSPPKLFPPLPLTISPPPYILSGRYCSSSSTITQNILTATTVYFLRPQTGLDFWPSENTHVPNGWILFADQSNPGKISIRRPFSNASFTLPINFPRTIDVHSFQPTELCRFYNINRHGVLSKLCVWSGMVRKVVLFSIACGYAVVVLSDEGKLGLLRLGFGQDDFSSEKLSSEAKWDVVHDGKGFRFDDIVDFKGGLLGIDRRARVYKIDIGDSSSPIVIKAVVPPITGGGGKRKRLVESLGCLYLVVRNNVRERTDPMFKVYELREVVKKWVEVTSLGGQTFFFGLEFSFSAPAEQLHSSRGRNCVMFKKRSFLNYSGYDDDSNLFQDINGESLHIGVWDLEDAAELAVIGSLPGYSKVFWPPPYWIWQIEMSDRVETLLTALDRLQLRIPDYEKLEAKLDDLSLRQQNCALTIIKSGINMKSALDQAREIDKMLKQIKEVSLLWQQRCDPSSDLQNQGGTVTLETEEQRQTARMLQNVIKQGNGILRLLSMEMKLHTFLLPLEEITSELEDVVKTRKFCASIDELPEHILFT